ncbi:MAG: class I SAM-dependent methyltransferase [Pseudomonadota bacterium]
MQAEGSAANSPLDVLSYTPHFMGMGVLETLTQSAGRARYTAAQGLRSAWYGGQYALARRRSAGFNRPGEPTFTPQNAFDLRALREAYFELFRQDRANIEAGLYPDPVAQEMRLARLPKAVRRARAFLADVAAVDRRRLERNGTEVRDLDRADPERFPTYYRQNFHYQTDGWLSDESAALYDHQVEALFTGAASAMRRAVLAELVKALKGYDQTQTKVLDLACGTGGFMAQVLSALPRLNLTGIDLSPPYAEKARQATKAWPQADVVEGLAEDLPFEAGQFDAITNIYLFHELPPRIRPRVIAEAARVLKPGGALIIGDSLQFGDVADLDGILEYFPEGFHEPYYKGYLGWDFAPQMAEAGFTLDHTVLAFLTKVNVWRKPV